MSQQLNPEIAIFETLWQSLEGGHYNLEELKRRLSSDSKFDDFGVDSLELIDFYLRLQDRFEITIQQEDFGKLTSVGAVRAYIEGKKNGLVEEKSAF